MIPLLLGLGNALVTVLAFAKLRWLSATILILIQIPWTIWDIANGLPGFLVLVPLGFVPMAMMLWEQRQARKRAAALRGWQDELTDWANVKLEIHADASGWLNQLAHIKEMAIALEPEEHDALEEHKDHLRTFDGED